MILIIPIKNNEEDNNILKSDQFKEILLMYSSALQEMETKLNIINNEFKLYGMHNPIEHIKTRIKSPNSISNKLKRKNLDLNYSNIIESINDIAGIRVVCSFVSDVYSMIECIEKFNDIEILERKDYIINQKESGYSSYHLLVSVPVNLYSGTAYVKVEIQIRTIAMDFWASLEHKINYKFPNEVPANVQKDLKECADVVYNLDKKMLNLNNYVHSTNNKKLTEL